MNKDENAQKKLDEILGKVFRDLIENPDGPGIKDVDEMDKLYNDLDIVRIKRNLIETSKNNPMIAQFIYIYGDPMKFDGDIPKLLGYLGGWAMAWESCYRYYKGFRNSNTSQEV